MDWKRFVADTRKIERQARRRLAIADFMGEKPRQSGMVLTLVGREPMTQDEILEELRKTQDYADEMNRLKTNPKYLAQLIADNPCYQKNEHHA